MPKVTISPSQGIVQEPGSGLTIKSDLAVWGQCVHRRPVIEWTADKTLTDADAGAIVFCTQTGTAIDLELPTAAAAGAGWFIDVYLKAASTAAANIDTQADTTLAFIHLADGHTDSNAKTVQEKQTLILSANATKNSRWNIVSNGSIYLARGFSGTGNELTTSDSGVS